MDWRQKIIDEKYNGDVKRYEADYADSVEEGRLYAVQWDDLASAATILLDLEQAGRDLIERRLGYLPHDSNIIPYEPFLRALIQSHRQNQITDSEYQHQVDEHIKLIRKHDLRHNTCLDYDPAIYKNYYRYFNPYGHLVRNRITCFLGYEPELRYSLIAEMWLRDVVGKNSIRLPDHMAEIDYKLMTLIKYREILLEHGQEAADASPFIQSWTEINNS